MALPTISKTDFGIVSINCVHDLAALDGESGRTDELTRNTVSPEHGLTVLS